MSINLLKMLQDQMGDSVVEQASKFLGESSANTSSGISALLPSLLGGVIGKGSTESGASGLLDMITKGNHDGGIMDSIGSMFGGGSSTSNLMNAGSLLTSALFGGSKLGSVLDVVTSVTGMRRSSSSSLMNLLAPVVMGMIGKQVKSGGLNAGGLMNMLMGQKDHVSSALPAGMGSILGFANAKDKVTSTVTGAASRTASAAKETVREAASVTSDAAATGGSWLRWALPLVLIVGIGGFLWNYMSGSNAVADAGNMVENAAGTMVDGASKTVNAAGDAVGNAAGTVAGAAGDMADGAKNMAGDMADGAKNMADGATAAGGKMVDGVKNAGGKMVDGAKNTGGKMVDGAKGMAGDMKAGGNKLGQKIKNAADKTGDAVAGAAGKTADAAGAAANAAGATLSAAGMKAKEKFSSMFKTGSSASAYGLHDITWAESGNRISNYDKDEVMALAAALKADPKAKIQVQAFGKNKVEAGARAQAIKQILTTLGVKAGQLSAKGMTDGADMNAVNVIVK